MAKRKQKKHKITFPALSFEKIALSRKLRKSSGFSTYETSFLLGKNPFFIRNLENPLNNICLDPDDTNYLALIHRKNVDVLTPSNIDIDDHILEVTVSLSEKRKTVYEIQIKTIPNSDGDVITIVEEDKDEEPISNLYLSNIEDLKLYILQLFTTGYFNIPRTALEIYDECRKPTAFGSDFHPRNMIKALNYFTNKKSGDPILDISRTNVFSRRIFIRPFDFPIESEGLSIEFRKLNINNFKEATNWINKLPNNRNTNTNDELIIFKEECGTSSTKHALLKRLSNANGHNELKLMFGIYSMDSRNTPAVKGILKKHSLDHLPFALCYLKVYGYILDYSGSTINFTKLTLDLLNEVEIMPDHNTNYRVEFHRNYLNSWIKEFNIQYSLDEIWSIRNECIAAISQNLQTSISKIETTLKK